MNQQETVNSTIAGEVRAFYDSHPYPPPVKSLEAYRRKWQDEVRRRADYHLFWPRNPYRKSLDILVAGCGTSQAARYALRHPESRVIGIDVSSTSIQETEKLKREYNLTNLEVVEQSIERVHELDRKFDKIVCTGVLHHLADPDVGLRALHDVLKSDGAMHVMVYAEFGRAGITMIQEYCRQLGIGSSEADITELAYTLMALPLGHPLARLLGESPDFRRKSALADALLNPQDRAYTVPQLFAFIQQAGLIFGRWLRQAPYLPYCGDLANTPHATRLAQLSELEQYTAVELFRGTMLRHSVIVYRNDNPNMARSIQFEDEQWTSAIPHRLPNTICVEEQLPANAAGVLINRSHTYPDIVLPISHKEKQLYEAIDGQRSVDHLIRREAINQPDKVRAFFEKLWRYDQVVYESGS